MQISSYYNSRSVTSLLKDTTQAASTKDNSPQDGNKSAARSATDGIGYSQGHSSLQQQLAALGVNGSSASRPPTGVVINPAEWISQSDIDLFHKVTGGTVKDGVIYDSNGNVDTSSRSMLLVDGLYEMRNYGTFDNVENRIEIHGAITVSDLQGFIHQYRFGGFGTTDLGVFADAVKVLTAEQA